VCVCVCVCVCVDPEDAGARSRELLVRAYKDVGAAHKLDDGDALVEETLREVKDALEALGVDWSSIQIPLPSPQAKILESPMYSDLL
jgi:nucleotide-binding universal stress UspA family protein